MTKVRVIPVRLNGAEPLAAAARFHAEFLPAIETELVTGASLVVRFDHAEDKPHGWRREAIAALARKYAPARVNAVAPAEVDSAVGPVELAIAFLFANESVTGQLLLAG